jgi:hypothetical protein
VTALLPEVGARRLPAAAAEARYSYRHLIAASAACAVLAIAVMLAVCWFPDNFFFFRAPWLLHPFEQEHLSMARNLAHGGGFSIHGDAWSQYLGSEDRGYIDGNYVPRSVILPYLIYAVPFLLSDSAWQFVGPVFGVLGAIAGGVIVFRRTSNLIAAASCSAVMLSGEMYLLASSGIAYESIIALAFLLWGVVALEMLVRRPSARMGAAAGLLFALCANSRADYAPAVLLMVAFLAGWLGVISYSHPRLAWNLRLPVHAAAAAALGLAGVGGILLTNYLVTGSPLQSAYGPDDWQGSADGLARGVTTFSLSEFVAQARLFLWDMGRPTLPLLGLFAASRIFCRRIYAGDFVLLGLSGFLAVYYLGREGSHSSEAAKLVASSPRYILPLYAAAAVVAFTALPELLNRLSADLPMVAAPVILSVALLASASGLNEAYTNKAGFGVLKGALQVHRSVHEFSEVHRDALFVGDFNTKAIILSQRLLIPRLVEDDTTMLAIVRDSMRAGREVYVVDDPRQLKNQPLYSGYLETLSAHGYTTCAVTRDMPVISEVVALSSLRQVQKAEIPANNGGGVMTGVLQPGKKYFAVVEGTFSFNNAGQISDGFDVRIGQTAAAPIANASHSYCVALTGTGRQEQVRVTDKVYTDNQGALTLRIYEAAR